MGEPTIRILQLAVVSGTAAPAQRELLHGCRRLVQASSDDEMQISLAFVRRRRQADTELAALAADLGIDYHALKRYGRWDATLLWRLRKLIKRLRIDVVHAHDAQSHLLALLVQPFSGIRTVATARDDATAERGTVGGEQADRTLLPGFHRVIAANQQLALQLCQLGCRSAQVDVVRAGVDTEQYSRQQVVRDLRAEWMVSPEMRLVGTTARAGDLERLTAACRELEPSVGPIGLVILAEETDPSLFGSSNGDPAGSVSYVACEEARPEVYAALDAFVQFDSGSAAARRLLEAQSMEVAVLFQHDRLLSEVVAPGTTGLSIEPGDDAALSAALASLLVDRRRAAVMAAAWRLRVCQQFQASAALQRIAQTYRRAYADA